MPLPMIVHFVQTYVKGVEAALLSHENCNFNGMGPPMARWAGSLGARNLSASGHRSDIICLSGIEKPEQLPM